MKYFCLIATCVGLLTTIYYKSKKSILIKSTEKMTRDQSTQTLISLDRDEGILVKETILNRNNNSNNSIENRDDNITNNFVNKWYDIII